MTSLWKRLPLTLALTLTSISAMAAETVLYVHTDHLGTPVAWTDEDGNVVKIREYEPYGQLLNGSANDSPGYTGHVEDAATGMVYMQQRYYDPGIGRFLSVDPVAAYSNPVGQFNRYWYANGNPFLFIDPTGMFGEILNPDHKGPGMVLVNDGQGNQMYVSRATASDTLAATSFGYDHRRVQYSHQR